MNARTALLAVALAALTSPAAALDLDFDVDFPSFSGFDATIQINGEPCPISVRIGLDEKGKYACIPGGCTVNGVPVVARGNVKPIPLADGGTSYSYAASLKSEKGAAEKVAIKVSGDLASGVADFQYKGPKGTVKLVGQPVDILADLALKIGRVSIDPQILDPSKPNKLGGTGSLSTGLGGESESGPLKISVSQTSISIGLKVGKAKASFKAKLEGSDAWVGTLSISAKPIKLKMPYTVPATGLLAALPPRGGGGRCSEKDGDAYNGEILMFITMFDDTELLGGSAEIYLSPAGNIFVVVSVSTSFSSHYFGDENCVDIDLPPRPGSRWFCLPVENYDYERDRVSGRGTVCLEVTSAEPTVRGRWTINASDGNRSGTFETSELGCGRRASEATVDAILDGGDPNVAGGFSVAPTVLGGAALSAQLSIGGDNFFANACADGAAVPAGPGDWLSANIFRQDFGVEDPELAGTLSIAVTALFPYYEGVWRLTALGGGELASGAWQGTEPICGFATDPLLFGQLEDAKALVIGNVTISETSRGSSAVDIGLSIGQRAFSVAEPCLDIDLSTGAPRELFTGELLEFDPKTGGNTSAGSLRFSIDTFGLQRGGAWSARDDEGAAIGSGRWSESAF